MSEAPMWAVIAIVWLLGFILIGMGEERPERPVRPTRAKPILCFFLGGGGAERTACEAFGGYSFVWWEVVCQPDPNCRRMP